jgi:hypothetical protein
VLTSHAAVATGSSALALQFYSLTLRTGHFVYTFCLKIDYISTFCLTTALSHAASATGSSDLGWRRSSDAAAVGAAAGAVVVLVQGLARVGAQHHHELLKAEPVLHALLVLVRLLHRVPQRQRHLKTPRKLNLIGLTFCPCLVLVLHCIQDSQGIPDHRCVDCSGYPEREEQL